MYIVHLDVLVVKKKYCPIFISNLGIMLTTYSKTLVSWTELTFPHPPSVFLPLSQTALWDAEQQSVAGYLGIQVLIDQPTYHWIEYPADQQLKQSKTWGLIKLPKSTCTLGRQVVLFPDTLQVPSHTKRVGTGWPVTNIYTLHQIPVT